MAAVVLIGAGEIGKINTVPSIFHKVEHFLYYGLMAGLLLHGLGRRWWWLAILLVACVGALDEWHQFYTPLRNASAYDWLTDVVGASVAVFLYRRFPGNVSRS